MAYDTLIAAASTARKDAYAPYSRFMVGAALLTHDGTVFRGCNVENASFGLTVCAERTAFYSAIAAGYKPGDFEALAVIADTEQPISPCGACRQIMVELGTPRLVVILANLDGARHETTAGALLPAAFQAEHFRV